MKRKYSKYQRHTRHHIRPVRAHSYKLWIAPLKNQVNMFIRLTTPLNTLSKRRPIRNPITLATIKATTLGPNALRLSLIRTWLSIRVRSHTLNHQTLAAKPLINGYQKQKMDNVMETLYQIKLCPT